MIGRLKILSFYVHKKRLLALGLDISIPFRADRNVLPMIRNQREITRFEYRAALLVQSTYNPVFI